MAGIRTRVRAHPVATFFLLAYALTWSIWFPVPYALKQGWIEQTTPVVVVLVAASFGPLVAAAVVTSVTGGSLRTWFAQALRWRVAPRWWLATLLIPPGLYAFMAAVHVGVLGGRLNWAEAAPLAAVPGVYLGVFLYGGGNEELGWRGFALPYLQGRYSALVASLVVGVVWTLWHAPLGIVEVGVSTWARDLPFYAVNVVGISVVATWLYNNSGGSVLLAMVLHAGVNGAQVLYPVEGLFTTTGEVARLVAWLALVVAILAVYGPENFTRRSRAPDATVAGAPAGRSGAGSPVDLPGTAAEG